MPAVKNLTGLRFGKLEVLKNAGYLQDGRNMWTCFCDCGNVIDVKGMSLVSGNVKSCWCLRSIPYIKGSKEKQHLYRVLKYLKTVCYNKNNLNYSIYGARGAVVCDEWLDNPNSFITWALQSGYKKGLMIVRKDMLKPFFPDNCRWVTRSERWKLRYEEPAIKE